MGGILLDLLFDLFYYLAFERRKQRPEELERRYGPERHPVDLLDAWARREGVRLLDFRRAEQGDFDRVEPGWRWRPASVLTGFCTGFRVHVAFPDGRRAWAVVMCGETEAGLRSDRVEGFWEPEPARALRRPPADDPLYDDSLDGAPTA